MMVGGVLVALAAAVANAFAIVLQAAEDRQTPLRESGHLSLLGRLLHRRRWLAGTGLMVVAWPLQILALGLAPITVVQPTLATTQLVLLAVARVRLRERVGPPELLGALGIVGGIAVIVWAAPRHEVRDPSTLRITLLLTIVGLSAVLAYVAGRLHPSRTLLLVLGAGLAYAWVDFANKLLADDLANGHLGLAAGWLAATLAFGALAFLEETSALQRRPAVTVAPVIGSVQEPLPVLMALAAGIETWGSGEQRIVPLLLGLVIVTAGATLLSRSRAVARVSGDEAEPVCSRRQLSSVSRELRRPRSPDCAAPKHEGAPATGAGELAG